MSPLEESAEEVAERHRELTIRHWRSVATLLEQREELRGVCAMADLIHDAVRWAA